MKRLGRIRRDAAKAADEALAELLAQGPDPAADILGAVAWAWTVAPEAAAADRVIGVALESPHRMIWREIAVACGVDPAADGGRAVHNFGQSWRRRERARRSATRAG